MVNELSECLLLQLSDVGEGFFWKLGLLLRESFHEVVHGCFDGFTRWVWLPVFICNVTLFDVVSI